jgi:hypothetical protein
MNVKVLSKIEKGYVKYHWSDVIHTMNLSVDIMDEVVDIINNFKKNKSAKEIIIFKYKNFPFYVTIRREEYAELLDFIKGKFINLELYERCKYIEEIKSKL